MPLFLPLRRIATRHASLLWLVLATFACAPLVWAAQPLARAIDVPYCSADALASGPHKGTNHEAPMHGRIVLVFSASAGVAGTSPHAAPGATHAAFVPPSPRSAGSVVVATIRPPTWRIPPHPPARAPPAGVEPG